MLNFIMAAALRVDENSEFSKETLFMSDDLTKRGPQDRSRINVHEPWELRWWCNELGVTADQLKQLVQKHGVSAAAIRRVLGK